MKAYLAVALATGLAVWAGAPSIHVAPNATRNFYLSGEGVLYTWGYSFPGSSTGSSRLPFPEGVTAWLDVASSGGSPGSTIALGNDQRLYRWGYWGYILAEDGSVFLAEPVRLPQPDGVSEWRRVYSRVSGNLRFEYALSADGKLFRYELAANAGPVEIPVPDPGGRWRELSITFSARDTSSAAGITDEGVLYFGDLFDSSSGSAWEAAYPRGVTQWVMVAGSYRLGDDGQVYSGAYQPWPMPASAGPVVKIAAGYPDFTPGPRFALDANGELYTWSESATRVSSPTLVPRPAGVDGWMDFSPGQAHTLALSTDGRLYGWGAAEGLGFDFTEHQLVPVALPFPNPPAPIQLSRLYSRAGSFVMTISGPRGVRVVVETSTDMRSWERVLTHRFDESSLRWQWLAPRPEVDPARYFRVIPLVY